MSVTHRWHYNKPLPLANIATIFKQSHAKHKHYLIHRLLYEAINPLSHVCASNDPWQTIVLKMLFLQGWPWWVHSHAFEKEDTRIKGKVHLRRLLCCYPCVFKVPHASKHDPMRCLCQLLQQTRPIATYLRQLWQNCETRDWPSLIFVSSMLTKWCIWHVAQRTIKHLMDPWSECFG